MELLPCDRMPSTDWGGHPVKSKHWKHVAFAMFRDVIALLLVDAALIVVTDTNRTRLFFGSFAIVWAVKLLIAWRDE